MFVGYEWSMTKQSMIQSQQLSTILQNPQQVYDYVLRIKTDYNLLLRYRRVKNTRIFSASFEIIHGLRSTGNNSERDFRMWLTVRLSNGYC